MSSFIHQTRTSWVTLLLKRKLLLLLNLRLHRSHQNRFLILFDSFIFPLAFPFPLHHFLLLFNLLKQISRPSGAQNGRAQKRGAQKRGAQKRRV